MDLIQINEKKGGKFIFSKKSGNITSFTMYQNINAQTCQYSIFEFGILIHNNGDYTNIG